jgi:hypothetical protein
MPRSSTSISMRAFLASYAQTANITKAAEAAKIDRGLHYRWLDTFPKYQKAFLEAERQAGDYLESVAVGRATEGVMEAVYYQGRPIGAVRRYSDGVMMTLLRGFKPKKYSNKTEISGPEGGAIEIVQRLNAARDRMNREDAEAALKAAEAE